MFMRKWEVGARAMARLLHQQKKNCGDIYVGCRVDKVTVCGASSPLGQTLSLLLKQTDLIRELHLHDSCNTRGIALDLDHIDTPVRVRPNSGDSALRNALKSADIVVLTNGFELALNSSEDDCLQLNGPIVYDLAVKVATICPEAFVCILSPPVNSLVPLFSEVMKRCQVYDPNKIFGLCSLTEMRCNTIIADYLSLDPALMNVPIIGGVSPLTSVPLFSQAQPFNEFSEEDIRLMASNILEIPKECQKLRTAAPLSTAYATLRFILTLTAGICCCDFANQTAFVRTDVLNHVKYFASVLKFGPKGVLLNYGLPKLTDYELEMLERALPGLERDIEKGIEMYKRLSKEDFECHETSEKDLPKKPFITKTPCPPVPCLPAEICHKRRGSSLANPCAPAKSPVVCLPRFNEHENC